MLEQFPYCPALHSRVAEIKALSKLPAATKDRLFPLIIARPWPNAKHLDRTWEKVGEAMGNRRYALDLDRTKRNSGASSRRPTSLMSCLLIEMASQTTTKRFRVSPKPFPFCGLAVARWSNSMPKLAMWITWTGVWSFA